MEKTNEQRFHEAQKEFQKTHYGPSDEDVQRQVDNLANYIFTLQSYLDWNHDIAKQISEIEKKLTRFKQPPAVVDLYIKRAESLFKERADLYNQILLLLVKEDPEVIIQK